MGRLVTRARQRGNTPAALRRLVTRVREGGITPEAWVTLVLLGAAVVFTFAQLSPSLIFAKTTPAGGDTGAHVWAPDFLRHHLLPHLRIVGWAPSWYGGFPLYMFYFPLPALMIVVLSFVLPYGIAFKLVSILGLLTLPVAAWAFGRLSGLRFPGPALLGLATVPFLFDRGFTIYGGNIASTLAGEFAFSISLSLALVFLGVLARSLDTGRWRALAAVLLALTGLSHLLPTLFAVCGGGALLIVSGPTPTRARRTFTVLGIGALLAAFWSVPFLLRLPYTNNMGWEKITQYSKNLFPTNLRWLVAMAAVGAVASVVFRRRTGLTLVLLALMSAAIFVGAPNGRLWNARALPFWYLCLYLLAGLAVAEVAGLLASLLAPEPEHPLRWVTLGAPVMAGVAVWVFVGLPLRVLPRWLPVPSSNDASFIPSWAKWNYSGYERKAAYPEYKGLIDTMTRVGRQVGCGRAHWEYESGLDRFGTPMALMLLPYWTHGCIDSMEGLYFESSATTPYHFLSAAELSKAPSDPQRDLPYRSLDVAAGVQHLQMLGARYYMAFSPEAISQARSDPNLRLVDSSGRWQVFEVAGSELVAPLAFKPAVLTGVKSGAKGWLDVSVDWFNDPTRRDVPLAASGPADWPRVTVRPQASTAKTVGSKVAIGATPQRTVTPAQVRNIHQGDDRISFDVDRTGSPVLVKASYFPNWKVSGAKGPWRVTPNMMVVIPTSRHVSMHYGYTPVDLGGWLLTAIGVALVVVLVRRRHVAGGRSDDGARSDVVAPPPPPVAVAVGAGTGDRGG